MATTSTQELLQETELPQKEERKYQELVGHEDLLAYFNLKEPFQRYCHQSLPVGWSPIVDCIGIGEWRMKDINSNQIQW